MQLGQLEAYSVFELGGVNYLILPTATTRQQQLQIVDVLKLDNGEEKELKCSVEVIVSLGKEELILACSRLIKNAMYNV